MERDIFKNLGLGKLIQDKVKPLEILKDIKPTSFNASFPSLHSPTENHRYKGMNFYDVWFASFNQHYRFIEDFQKVETIEDVEKIDWTFLGAVLNEISKHERMVKYAENEAFERLSQRFVSLRGELSLLEKSLYDVDGIEQEQGILLKLFQTHISCDIYEFAIGKYFGWDTLNMLNIQLKLNPVVDNSPVHSEKLTADKKQEDTTNEAPTVIQWALYTFYLQEVEEIEYFESMNFKTKIDAIKSVIKGYGLDSAKHFQLKYNLIRKDKDERLKKDNLEVVIQMLKPFPKAQKLAQDEINLII